MRLELPNNILSKLVSICEQFQYVADSSSAEPSNCALTLSGI
jgi:hypothetical protein